MSLHYFITSQYLLQTHWVSGWVREVSLLVLCCPPTESANCLRRSPSNHTYSPPHVLQQMPHTQEAPMGGKMVCNVLILLWFFIFFRVNNKYIKTFPHFLFQNLQFYWWCPFIVDCAAVTGLSPLTSDPLNCHLDSNCNKVSCCVDSTFTSRTFEAVMDIDPCTRTLTLEIEDLKAVIPWSEIKWSEFFCFRLFYIVYLVGFFLTVSWYMLI